MLKSVTIHLDCRKLLTLLFMMAEGLAFSDVKSIDGPIRFDVNSDAHAEMILSNTGLGIGTTPSANLHVDGNAIVTDQVSVGSLSASSNLYVSGTMGLGFTTITTNVLVENYSLILVDTDTAGADVDMLLPYSGNNAGRIYTIKNLGSTYSVNIGQDSSAGYFDLTYESIRLQDGAQGSIELIANGNSYYILSQQGSLTTSFDDTPLSFGNLVLWLDASDGDTLTIDSTGNVTEWLDKSDNAYVFDDSGGGNTHPAVTTSWRNGLNALSFDPSAKEYLRSTTDLSYNASAYSVFVVFDNNSSLTTTSMFTIDYQNNGANPTLAVPATSTGSFALSNRHVGNQGSSVSTVLSLNTPYVTAGWFDASLGTLEFYVNEGAAVTENADADLLTNLQADTEDAWVGSHKLTGSDRWFGGNIAEVIFYSRHLDAAEIDEIEAYLSDKWGI